VIDREPIIQVGVIQGTKRARWRSLGGHRLGDGRMVEGELEAHAGAGGVELCDDRGAVLASGAAIELAAAPAARFTLHEVVIGIGFHWERQEDQTFAGDLRLLAVPPGRVTVVNRIGLEAYLESVISSEMSAASPPALLEAHAITSRSWLAAMLARQKREKHVGVPARRGHEDEESIIRWYDREDHADFDVCADDHCQRYQGVTKASSPAAARAVAETRGLFLVHGGAVCDARFFKACGGRTDEFQNAWEEVHVPYLQSVGDGAGPLAPITTEAEAAQWIHSAPDVFCNTSDGAVLRQVLPGFDQETTDFFRWRVRYTADALSALVRERSGIDFGRIDDLVPLERGPSGRIVRLRIVGSRRCATVGKELEIRKWLSKSHLYSSAFVVEVERDVKLQALAFTLHGAGWGHGVGLCQIGAAVMATRGYTAEQIVRHYFTGATLARLY
jgi:SpoIID/LytB domain protein